MDMKKFDEIMMAWLPSDEDGTIQSGNLEEILEFFGASKGEFFNELASRCTPS